MVQLVLYRGTLLPFHSTEMTLWVGSLIPLGGFDNAPKLRRTFSPSERTTGLNVVGEKALEEFFEILLRSLHAVLQRLP